MRHSNAITSAFLAAGILTGCAAGAEDTAGELPATTANLSYADLVQQERAFGDRAGDVPPGACHARRDSYSARSCLTRRINTMQAADFDQDGWVDIRVVRDDGTISYYHNRAGMFELTDITPGEVDPYAPSLIPGPPASRPELPAEFTPPDHTASWVKVDLNGDGVDEIVVGRGGSAAEPDSLDYHVVTRPPSTYVRTADSWAPIHLLDLERRRMIGFSDLIAVVDVTGDLVPDLIIAGEGMAHPQLYRNTAPAANFAAISVTGPATIVLHRPGGDTTIRSDGWHSGASVNVPIPVGLGGRADVKATVTFDTGETRTATLRAATHTVVDP